MYFHSFFCCYLTFPEELLNNFAQQIGAWRFCLYFLSSTRNDYVMMYSLTVFEVSCQILLYYSEEYFVVTLPCPWRWTSLLMCTWLGNKRRDFFPRAAFVRILSPWFQKVRWGKVGRSSVVTYNFLFPVII